ncbi:MAG: molybdate ABC transporter substrate-binding protein [Spirochaetia bacterium]|jgi:molybdate transport system substrate-binding protein
MNSRILVTGLLLTAWSTATSASQDITLAAAANLTDVLFQIQDDAQKAVGVQIFVNLGLSGTLRRQIEEGAPVDVFFSAAHEDMEALAKEGLIIPGSRRDFLRDSLVMIGEPGMKPAAGPQEVRYLLKSAHAIAICNPDSMPAGRYAVEALKKYGMYDSAKTRLALGGSFREVLQLVQNRSVPLGLVFLTDALSAQRSGSIVRIFRFPAETFSEPIVYPVAVTTASRNKSKAEKLIEFLQGDVARGVFEKAGFEVP